MLTPSICHPDIKKARPELLLTAAGPYNTKNRGIACKFLLQNVLILAI
jgi:hypothetical protein